MFKGVVMSVSPASSALALVATAARTRQDAASAYAADIPVQKAELAVEEARLAAAERGNSSAFASTSGLTSRETERLKTRTEHLTKALNRLLAATGKPPAGAALALVSGAATGSGGVTLAATAQRIDGVYTDFKAGLSPRQYYNDAARNDQLSLAAEEVANVYSAGGADAVAITAGLVEAVYTGNNDDTVAITAEIVRDIYTDEEAHFAPDRQGADTVAIIATSVESVYTGGGNDAVAISAHLVESLYTEAGNDRITLAADLLGGIDAGAGDDVIDVTAIAGRQIAKLGEEPVAPDLATAAARLAATAGAGGIDGGAGNDTIQITAAGPITVAGGAGDDVITLEGGSVGLYYGAGDGTDRVRLGAGTEVLLRLTAPLTGYAIERGEDSLTLRIGNGAITFSGVSRAGMIAVALGTDQPQVLSPGATLDRAV